MVRLQQEFVKNDVDGYGLWLFSSQFVEHAVQLLKQTCSRHCNSRAGWLMYIAKLNDIHSLGPLHLNLIDLGSIVHKKKQLERLLNITDESQDFDNLCLEQTSDNFQQNIIIVETIQFGGAIPNHVRTIMENGPDDSLWTEQQFKDYKTQMIYQLHNTQSALTQQDWEEDIDGPLNIETVARSRVHVPGSAELPDDENDAHSRQLFGVGGDSQIQHSIDVIEEENENENINNDFNGSSGVTIDRTKPRKIRRQEAMALRHNINEA